MPAAGLKVCAVADYLEAGHLNGSDTMKCVVEALDKRYESHWQCDRGLGVTWRHLDCGPACAGPWLNHSRHCLA